MSLGLSARRYWLKNSSREYLRQYNEEFARDTKPGMIVLDAGAGEQPYRDFFHDCTYESADFEQVDKRYAKSTYLCDLVDIPVEDGRFDRIVFNQVLEHLPDASSVLSEFNRILKPGGKIICTCPLFYDEHEKPYDFYRYTQFGLRYLFEKFGFKIERIEWMEGYFGAVAYQFQGMAQHIPLSPHHYLRWPWWPALVWSIVALTKFSALALSGMFYRLDLVCKITDRGYPKNYVVIVQKEA